MRLCFVKSKLNQPLLLPSKEDLPISAITTALALESTMGNEILKSDTVIFPNFISGLV